MNASVLRDGFHFASLQTPKRVINAAKVFSSYYISRLLQKPIHKGFPLSLSIEPTTSCNLRCPECPSGLRSFSRPTGMLEENLYKKIIDEISSHTSYLIFYFQGEPYLHPKFLEMVRYAQSKKIYTATSTNAHYLKDENARSTVESGLSRLIVSMDGVTQEVYEQYRVGGKLDKVLSGIENVLKWKKELKSKTPHVILQFLVTGFNEHQIADVKRLGKRLGVDEVRLKTAQVYDYKNGSDVIPKDEKYSRYRIKADGTYELNAEAGNHCWRMWQGCVITWDGRVVPCCFDKDATHVLGNMQEQSFEKIWKGKSYQNFRASLMKSRNEIDICTNCSEGLNVWN
jgi:radical SAM protein with 4Fe4S-binding SPASM domain